MINRDVILWNTGPTDNVYKFNLYRTLGSYKIAHAVRNAGYTAQVIDHFMRMTEDELYACTRKFIDENTSAIGISTTFALGNGVHQLSDPAVNTLNRLKKEFPKLNIVFGGYNINSLQLEKHLNSSVHAIINYGEDIFVDLLKYFKGQGRHPICSIQFVGNRYIKVYNKALEEKYNIEVDDFKFTDQDCIMPGETLPIEISRGCIFKCKFCNHLMLGRAKLDYLRDFELVKEDMINNYDKWGVTNYYIICDTFNDTEIKMKAWQQMVNSLPFKIKYTAYLRADLLDKFPDVPYILQETGLFTAFHGIETLSVKGSSIIGKGWSGKSAKEYIPKLYHDIWQNKIHQTLSFIVGLPGDTKETFYDTVDWFKSNDLYQMAIHTLGIRNNWINKNPSEFDRNAEQYGYKFPKKDNPGYWENDNWTFDEVEIFTKEQNTKLGKDVARYGSWNILQLLQYGVDPTKFEKKASWNDDMKPMVFNLIAQQYLQDYIGKILALEK
jgi:radical SAM superfamily enzyme